MDGCVEEGNRLGMGLKGDERVFTAVIFDCFGVLMTELGHVWMEKHHFDDDKRKAWRQISYVSDLGEMSENDLYRQSGKMIGATGGEVDDEWQDIVRENWPVIEVVREVRKAGYKVAILSNATRMIRKYLERMNLENEFDAVFVSSELKVAKPDVKIYELAARGLGVTPSECIMVDDKERCVAGAWKSGMLGIQYENGMDLRAVLREVGIRL